MYIRPHCQLHTAANTLPQNRDAESCRKNQLTLLTNKAPHSPGPDHRLHAAITALPLYAQLADRSQVNKGFAGSLILAGGRGLLTTAHHSAWTLKSPYMSGLPIHPPVIVTFDTIAEISKMDFLHIPWKSRARWSRLTHISAHPVQKQW